MRTSWIALPLLAALLLSARSAHAADLSADTGSATGLFKAGDGVQLTFTATGASGQTLTVTTRDADGNVVDTQKVAIAGDPYTTTLTGYAARLGFYRVDGRLDDGTSIDPVGSRAPIDGSPSFLTYAVVFDPGGRSDDIDEDHAFFGLQGGINPQVGTDILAYLGVRWMLDSQWTWHDREPYAGQRNTFGPTPSASDSWPTNGGKPWRIFTIPNMTVNGRPYAGSPDVYLPNTFAYNTGALDPQYDNDWQMFLANVATSWPQLYPNRKDKIYEITWEPIAPWGYGGTLDQLVNLYQLAFQSIKATDPGALVMGPTMGFDDLSVFDHGLGANIDVFSAHPYLENDEGYDVGHMDPENQGIPSRFATARRTIAAHAGKVLPMIGTEQGYRTRQDPTQEILQAKRLVRSNLLMLGDGWKMNTAFYGCDYPSNDDWNGQFYWDWGFFYNLDEGSYGGYAPAKMSPKPVAAAYSAMTYLLEGRKSVTDVNWLSDTTRGYVYENVADASDEVMAVWDFGGAPKTITFDAGAASVEVFDWMGNEHDVATNNGSLTLTLTDEPTYVRGLAASIWGSAKKSVNVAPTAKVTTSGDSDATTPGSLAIDGDMWANESRWISTSDGNEKWIELDFASAQAIGEVRFFTGEYDKGANANSYNHPLSSYSLQRWDGSQFTDIVARSSNTNAVVDEVFTPVMTNKLRLYVAAGEASSIELFEIQAFTPAPPDTSASATGSSAASGGETSGTSGATGTGGSAGTGDGKTSGAGGASAMDGDTDDGSMKGGCGCRTANDAPASTGVVVVLAALAAMSRRRQSLRWRARSR